MVVEPPVDVAVLGICVCVEVGVIEWAKDVPPTKQ